MQTKSRKVLTRTSFQRNPTHFTFFGELNEDDNGYQYHTGIYIQNQEVEDMGQPLHITVTVEPGDLLNDEERAIQFPPKPEEPVEEEPAEQQ